MRRVLLLLFCAALLGPFPAGAVPRPPPAGSRSPAARALHRRQSADGAFCTADTDCIAPSTCAALQCQPLTTCPAPRNSSEASSQWPFTFAGYAEGATQMPLQDPLVAYGSGGVFVGGRYIMALTLRGYVFPRIPTQQNAFVYRLDAATGEFDWAWGPGVPGGGTDGSAMNNGEQSVQAIAASGGLVYVCLALAWSQVALDATTTYTAAGGGDALVVALDQAGALHGYLPIHSTGFDACRSLSVGEDGGIWAAGVHANQLTVGSFSLPYQGGQSVGGTWVVKLNGTVDQNNVLAVEAATTIPGGLGTFNEGLFVADGPSPRGVFVAGHFINSIYFGNGVVANNMDGNTNSREIYVVELSASTLAPVRAKTIGGPEEQYLSGLAWGQDSSGNPQLLVAGRTRDTMDIDGVNLFNGNGPGGSDFVLSCSDVLSDALRGEAGVTAYGTGSRMPSVLPIVVGGQRLVAATFNSGSSFTVRQHTGATTVLPGQDATAVLLSADDMSFRSARRLHRTVGGGAQFYSLAFDAAGSRLFSAGSTNAPFADCYVNFLGATNPNTGIDGTFVFGTGFGSGLSFAPLSPGVDCPVLNISATEVLAPPALTASYNVSSEVLTFVLESPVYNNGTSTLRTMTMALGGSSSCSVGPSFPYTSPSCVARQTLTGTWAELRSCGWIAGPDVDGTTEVRSNVTISWTDTVSAGGAAGTQRTGQSSRPVSFTFPTSAIVDGGAGVNATIGNDSFAVQSFSFFSGAGGQRTLQLRYTLSTEFPFRYAFSSVTYPNAGMQTTSSNLDTEVPAGCATGSWTQGSCVQVRTVSALLDPAVCDVSGTYSLLFASSCVNGGCQAGAWQVDVSAGTVPVCGTALDGSVQGVVASLVPAVPTVPLGSTIQLAFSASSPNKRMVRCDVADISVRSAKHAADPSWALRTLLVAGVPSALGTALGVASANGFVQQNAGGAASFADTLSFSATAGSDPAGALLKSSDVGTSDNAFQVELRAVLYYDVQSLPGRRRRLRSVDIDAVADLAPGIVELELRSEPAPGSPRHAARQRVRLVTEVPASILPGLPQRASASVVVLPAPPGVPVGAIVGLVVGIVLLGSGLVTAAVVLRRKRKAAEAQQVIDAADEPWSEAKVLSDEKATETISVPAPDVEAGDGLAPAAPAPAARRKKRRGSVAPVAVRAWDQSAEAQISGAPPCSTEKDHDADRDLDILDLYG
ncbi:hypothetical protein DFJ74DRAFT_750983 [Hyaloraphidium curvatum]|nr:hypothetical protein DFJ74DRAFT_750983 [Hyaloraphidium curvatum]